MDEQTIAELVKLLDSKMPEWWTSYAAQLAYNLQVHTKGLMFDKITGLFPNEHPESQQHCINSYESITKDSIWKAINNIIRIFNNSSFNINTSDKAKKIIKEYEKNDGSFFSQFLEDWIRYAVATDPNGLCVVYPVTYTPDLYRYVCYKDIIKVSDDVLIFISEDESEVKTEFIETECVKETIIDYNYELAPGIPNVKYATVKTYNRRLEKTYINTVYHVFTKTHFIRFYKDDPGDKELKFEWVKFTKELQTLPYFENGGIEIENNLYESFVQSFVPFGNLCLMAHRNQRAVELMHYYPKMSEVQQPCDTCNGTGQTLCETGRETCKTCKGSKYVTAQSPYKVYRKVNDSFDTDGKVFSTPSVEYYSPDVAVLTKVDTQWKDYKSMAEEAVFVPQKIQTGNVEAAKSKEIDLEGKYDWLANIKKVLFNNIQMFLQYQENYISASPFKVSVEQPYSLAILTESEAFDALSLILASPSPVPIKANQIDNFINKFVSESSPVKRAFSILKKYDMLLYFSNDEVMSLKAQGAVSGKMVQQHALAYPVLIRMYETDLTLFDLEDKDIITKLSAEVDKFDLTKDIRTNLLTAVAQAATA